MPNRLFMFPYTENLFLSIYWDKEKTKMKEQKYDHCKWNYGYIIYVLNIVSLTKEQEKICLFVF